MIHDWRKMPEGVPVPKLRGCEPCRYWGRYGCGKRKPGFPDVGEYCYDFEREPGVEG